MSKRKKENVIEINEEKKYKSKKERKCKRKQEVRKCERKKDARER